MQPFNPDVDTFQQSEGETNVVVSRSIDGKVILEFDKPVKWVALNVRAAEQVAKQIRKCAINPRTKRATPRKGRRRKGRRK